MGKIEDIEKAVSELSAEELARFRAWYAEFDARCFDDKIERDAKAGTLDKLAEKALADHNAGHSREAGGAASGGRPPFSHGEKVVAKRPDEGIVRSRVARTSRPN